MRFYIDQILKDMLIDFKINADCLLSLKNNRIGVSEYLETLKYLTLRNHTIDFVSKKNIMYIPIQKAATSRIRRLLSEIGEHKHIFHHKRTNDLYGNPPNFRNVLIRDFCRILHSPDALRFTFVRNPYHRLLSAWSSKFEGRPLIYGKLFTRGTPEIDAYLKLRKTISNKLPYGPEQTLKFKEFVEYATNTIDEWKDLHIKPQANLIKIPKVSLNFIGKLETYSKDIKKVLYHAGANESLYKKALIQINNTKAKKIEDYYTKDLFSKVYKAYKNDFEIFEYKR